jgi:hypothetical protein
MDWVDAAKRVQAEVERALTMKETSGARCRRCRKRIVIGGLCWMCSQKAKA